MIRPAIVFLWQGEEAGGTHIFRVQGGNLIPYSCSLLGESSKGILEMMKLAVEDVFGFGREGLWKLERMLLGGNCSGGNARQQSSAESSHDEGWCSSDQVRLLGQSRQQRMSICCRLARMVPTKIS